jgi:hypothetical protein
MMFMEVIAVEHKNDVKQIITLWWGGGCRFCSFLKQVVRTVNHCLKGMSYLVAIWLPLGRFIVTLI